MERVAYLNSRLSYKMNCDEWHHFRDKRSWNRTGPLLDPCDKILFYPDRTSQHFGFSDFLFLVIKNNLCAENGKLADLLTVFKNWAFSWVNAEDAIDCVFLFLYCPPPLTGGRF